MNPQHDNERPLFGDIVIWIGVALLSASWLPGLGYYHAVNWTAWSVLVALGAICMTMVPGTIVMSLRARVAASLLSLPALLIAPWPYRAGVLSFVLGCVLQGDGGLAVPSIKRLQRRLGIAAMVTGVVLLVQAVTVNAYVVFTSRSHELPPPFPAVLGGVTSLLGIESAVHDQTIALHSMRSIHRLGATWELLFDPLSVCFVVAAIFDLWFSRTANLTVIRREDWRRLGVALAVVVLLWLPLRAGLLIGLYLQNVLRTPYEAELDAMRQFWNTGLLLVLMVGPVMIFTVWGPRWKSSSFERNSGGSNREFPRPDAWRIDARSLALIMASSLLITVGLFWDPVGTRQAGRVVIEEHHPDPARIWEPTGRPYDTNWYGQSSGYNYACIYDYCSRFFTMSRWTQPITAEVLDDCDVLVLKVPTRPYSAAEIEHIVAFVEHGGGLMLIGEHTNVYRTSDYLNVIADRFGFQFRADCLFGVDSVFDQTFRPPLIPHPIVQRIPTMDFATSCSIAPGLASGRAPIRSLALKNKMADYHADNYYPQPNDDASMRYGAFVQLWAVRHGKGRVVAFSDSTMFSNFCVFDPGKAELFLGMIDWLNHRSYVTNPRPWFVSCGLLLAALSVVVRQRRSIRPVAVLAAVLFGWAAGVGAVWGLHAWSLPPPSRQRDYVQVAIDRNLSNAPLSKNGFVDASGEGFGVFAQWILRLGYFSSRVEGHEVFDADLVLLIAPDRAPSKEYLTELDRYLCSGGVVAIVDGARVGSTANLLLQRYGLMVKHDDRLTGTVKGPADWPAVDVQESAGVEGGEPFAWVEGQPVATRIRRERGTLVVVGFGARFQDAHMGHGMDVTPDAELEQVFQLEYTLLRWLVAQNQDGG